MIELAYFLLGSGVSLFLGHAVGYSKAKNIFNRKEPK